MRLKFHKRSVMKFVSRIVPGAQRRGMKDICHFDERK